MADQILDGLPPRPPTFGELIAHLNREVAQLTAHYDNSRWLAETADSLAFYTADQMELLLRVAGRQFKLSPTRVWPGLEHLGQLAPHLMGEEKKTGLNKIISVADSIRAIYDMAFHQEGEAGPEDADAGESLQPMQPAQVGQ
jgi:hypothetical protein